jgi:hypothetical protein
MNALIEQEKALSLYEVREDRKVSGGSSASRYD